MTLRLSGVVRDSIVDGPGLRLAVFTQGCPHHCPGCHNPGTHNPLGGYVQAVCELAAMLDENPLLTGLTLSGGEPFSQAAPCARLAAEARRRGRNIWTYTGWTYEELLGAEDPDWDALLALTDVLVDGRFVLAERNLRLRFRGSENQRILDLARTRETGQLTLWAPPDPLTHFVRPPS